ncbi:MAG: hypothetical protein ISS31_07895 [Kiritimatiellae bacterium]|nr:hypothetical protein [Kiritimatiellia bacterium]
MTTEDLTQAIVELPVFDTHSHLNAPGRSLAAQSFADIGHYFWLSQQMQGVGWEASEELDQRAADAYFDAFIKTENTSMNWCLRRILRDLYGIAIRSPKDVLAADATIKERAEAPSHVEDVCRKGNIKKVVQNLESQAHFPEAPWLGVLVPDNLNAPVTTFMDAPSDEAVNGAVAALGDTVDALAQAGHAGARIDFNLFEAIENEEWRRALLDAIFSRLHHHKMFVQIFLGMKRESTGSFPQNDPDRITALYPFFHAYRNCRFELLCAAEGNGLDLVQAAVLHPNVNPGGLWWYNFRPSIFMQAMQYRLEALAPLKCPILASDATCIEWCYGKSMLVKTLVAEFMAGRVNAGWITPECALRTASAWLHDAPAAYYK